MASEITLLDEMFRVDEVDSGRYDRGKESSMTSNLSANHSSFSNKSDVSVFRLVPHSRPQYRDLSTRKG